MKKRFHSLALTTLIFSVILLACSEEEDISPLQLNPPPLASPPPNTPPTPIPPPTPAPPPTPPVGHVAPIANAGNDTTIYTPFHSHTLKGKTSTGIVSYEWRIVTAPPNSNISYSYSSSSPWRNHVSFLKVGVHEFELTVTDAYNFSAKDTVKVTVAEPICSTNIKEIIFKDLRWGYPWFMETSISNLFSHLPPNSYVKSFYIKRDGSDKWETIVPVNYSSPDAGKNPEWEFYDGRLIIYPGSDTREDTPDVKIEYCN